MCCLVACTVLYDIKLVLSSHLESIHTSIMTDTEISVFNWNESDRHMTELTLNDALS